ncbi:hypothetical protein ACFLYH_02240, partial [Candidatus Dependentiae bacterium]
MKKHIFNIIFMTSIGILIFSSHSMSCINFSDYEFAQPSYFTTAYVYSHNLRYNIEQAAKNYLSTANFSIHNIPNKLLPEYNLKIDETITQLQREIDISYNKTISYTKIKNTTEKILAKFHRKLKKIIINNDLDIKVGDIINQLVNTYQIPYSEYNYKKNKILNKLRQTMAQDNRNYVRRSEVKKEIKKRFNTNFEQNHNFSWNNFWNDYFV